MRSFLSMLAIIVATSLFAQIPSASVTGLDGKKVDAKTFSNAGKPMIISFWATWCAPCKRELNAIAEVYDEWQKTTGVKLIAVSIDDARSSARVGPYVNGQAWDYEVYLDPNGDLKRAMNVQNVPHTVLIDGSGKIVWQHNVYNPGDENELYAKLKALTAK
ncbi:MAG: TlpA family protein disulfide reductase [Flavobacteriales bacterium]|nr:TlpA family protein disulfide reductase [Flavobacteriales bacterium]MBP6574478.1 TlpA family protein disulfide reductase [Flavobacteriales bacterium]